ncbi:hypothetical protein SELMODRAFT_416196 [Selaginella moellendorffii]|uniref:B box-type domain-containing protein n=1 Tax=Selaginella moellendorffii TaxID=88036 RepID=D8RYD8_SELML|nr:hypothetical protein SELMODRAFT_416196 [Selaginella moellendorffii]
MEERASDDIQASSSSSWLLALMGETNFFKGCPTHPDVGPGNRKLASFCRACEKALCKECDQRDHKACKPNILQVLSASRFAALKVDDIAPLIDTSGLETFKINGNYIHFLHGRPRNATLANKNQCRHCNRVLLTTVSLYCSIQCKYRCNADLAPRPLARPVQPEDFQARAARVVRHPQDHRNFVENREALKIEVDQQTLEMANVLEAILVKVPKRKRVSDANQRVATIFCQRVCDDDQRVDQLAMSKKRRRGSQPEPEEDRKRSKRRNSRREKEEMDPWALEDQEREFWTFPRNGRSPSF